MALLKEDIQYYMMGLSVFAALMFCLIIAYFPDKPPVPPSAESSVSKTDFTQGWTEMLGNRQLWLVCLAFALPGGVQIAWQGLMGLSFQPLGVTDTQLGLIGFSAIVSEIILCSIVAYFMDRFRDRVRQTVLILLSASTFSFLILGLMCIKILPATVPLLGLLTITGVSTFYACMPLLLTLAVDIARPVSEGMVGAFLTGVYNLVCCVFLLLPYAPDGTAWMSAVLALATGAAIPLMYCAKVNDRGGERDRLIAPPLHGDRNGE